MIFLPQELGFCISLCSGEVNSPFRKNSLEFVRGDGQAWNSLIHYCSKALGGGGGGGEEGESK